MAKYKISPTLFGIDFYKIETDQERFEYVNKLNLDSVKVGSSLVELTDEELQQKIQELKAQGHDVNTYHEKLFRKKVRFVKD